MLLELMAVRLGLLGVLLDLVVRGRHHHDLWLSVEVWGLARHVVRRVVGAVALVQTERLVVLLAVGPRRVWVVVRRLRHSVHGLW